jgi:biopolymer transport protein ExbD
MSTFAFRPPKSRRETALNVTPLIDVLFLLIIFFTLTSTFKRAGQLELELPASTTSTPAAAEPDPSEVEVVVLESGAILLDGNAVSADELGERLAAAHAANADGHVRLLAEAAVPHGEVVHLLDLVRQSGFRGAAIGTYREGAGGTGAQ